MENDSIKKEMVIKITDTFIKECGGTYLKIYYNRSNPKNRFFVFGKYIKIYKLKGISNEELAELNEHLKNYGVKWVPKVQDLVDHNRKTIKVCSLILYYVLHPVDFDSIPDSIAAQKNPSETKRRIEELIRNHCPKVVEEEKSYDRTEEVLSMVRQERVRQMTKWSALHDNSKSFEDWQKDIEAYVTWAFQMQRMDSMEKCKRRLTQSAALIVALLERM